MNEFGKLLKLNIYGTSHNESFGILMDNVPVGIKLNEEDFLDDLNRRKPSKKYETKRNEEDKPNIKSGLFNGYTNGTPLVIEFNNQNVKSNDYADFVNTPRPSHADFVANKKYHGFNDYRGGGAFSGRLTAGIVCAGVVAKKICGYRFETKILQIGSLKDMDQKDKYLEDIANQKDSIGGIIQIKVKDVPIGLGEPYFYSVESAISQILYSIGSVKGVSFGIGFDGVNLKGSEFNDVIIDKQGHTKTNNNGGINGGISNGNDLIINVFVKPIASIMQEQETFDFKENKMTTLEIQGRHDVSIVERVMVVLEDAVAVALADLYLLNKALY